MVYVTPHFVIVPNTDLTVNKVFVELGFSYSYFHFVYLKRTIITTICSELKIIIIYCEIRHDDLESCIMPTKTLRSKEKKEN